MFGFGLFLLQFKKTNATIFIPTYTYFCGAQDDKIEANATCYFCL